MKNYSDKENVSSLIENAMSKIKVGIIGGADGPTQIMVARAVNPISDWIFALIGVITAGIGIYATRQK